MGTRELAQHEDQVRFSADCPFPDRVRPDVCAGWQASVPISRHKHPLGADVIKGQRAPIPRAAFEICVHLRTVAGATPATPRPPCLCQVQQGFLPASGDFENSV